MRAQIMLQAAQGRGDAAIARETGAHLDTVRTWRVRFADGGLPALVEGQGIWSGECANLGSWPSLLRIRPRQKRSSLRRLELPPGAMSTYEKRRHLTRCQWRPRQDSNLRPSA
ncbi:helix-turn-helix domain-containing protein [Streptomyces pulveraceus]|uniref:Helix-turn-helix domain-containing protein n=1 Tax=Streptomyces pulveraceus TaxID=68258 RepID=A0ABW1GKM9_9ACTN